MSAPVPPRLVQSTYKGGCHCGAVRFESELDLDGGVGRCNCTLLPHAYESRLSAPSSRRKRTSEFLFCKRCGIHVFGRGDIPQIGGAYVSVNVNCLDDLDPATLKVIYWDGRHDNWQAGPRDAPWPVHA